MYTCVCLRVCIYGLLRASNLEKFIYLAKILDLEFIELEQFFYLINDVLFFETPPVGEELPHTDTAAL